MTTIDLSKKQILTCRDLLQDKITGVNILKYHEKMELEQAQYHEQEASIKVCKQKIKEFENEVKDLKYLLKKFDKSIRVIN